MNEIRFLTAMEAAVVARATEHWLRLRDVEFNPAEQAVELLWTATLRSDSCRREDIASLGRTMLLQPQCGGELVELTLVLPDDEDLRNGQVSVLSPLGLACLGQVAGNLVRLPHGSARFVGLKENGARERRRQPAGGMKCQQS